MRASVQLAGLLVLYFLFLVFILPRVHHGYDISTYLKWINLIHKNGLGAIYESNTNYHPFFLYCMWVYQWFQGTEEFIAKYKHYIKVFPLFFEFVGAASIFLLVKLNYKNLFLPFLLLFNFGYLYNAILWGQTDGIYAAFSILAVIFALRQQVEASMAFFLLALNTKLQAIVFFPLLGLLWLPFLRKEPLKVVTGIVIVALLQFLILWPFIQAGTVNRLFMVATGATERIPIVSIFAYNIWHLFITDRPFLNMHDKEIFAMGFSYRFWGLAMFCISSFVALLPLLIRSLAALREKVSTDRSFQKIAFLTGGLIALGFFFFNTQMHERYAHPAIIFFFFYGVLSRNYAPFIMISFCELLILEQNFRYLRLKNYETILFSRQFIAIIFYITYLVALYDLYFVLDWWRSLKKFFRKTAEPTIAQ